MYINYQITKCDNFNISQLIGKYIIFLISLKKTVDIIYFNQRIYYIYNS